MTAPALPVDGDRPQAGPEAGPTTPTGAPRRALPLGLMAGLLATVLGAAGAQGRPLWLDEAYSLAATRDLDVALEAARGSMGLYYAAVWLWGQVADGALWLRLPSQVAMGVAVALFARLVGRQHGRATAAGAGLAVAVSYAVVRYAPEARSYALVCLAVVGSWSALDRGLADPDDRRAWHLHRLCCLALPLLHGLGTVQLLVQAGALVVAGVRGRSLRQAAVGLGGGLVVLGAALAVGSGRSGDWVPPLTLAAARNLVEALTVPLDPLGMVAVALVLAASALLARRAAEAPAGLARFRLVMPVAWGPAAIAVILAVSLVRPAYLARYAVASAFGVALVLVLAAREVDRRRRGPGGLARVPLATVVVVALLGLGSLVALSADGDRWDSAVAVVSTGARPGDVVVFPTADARLPFDAEWREGAHPTSPEVAGSSEPLGAVRRVLDPPPLEELLGELDGAPRVWVVTQLYLHVANPDLASDPAVVARYRRVRSWDLGADITVTLLAARGAGS
ncbi:MAG TPA: hypothetical protein VEW93_15350 [Acidimicrobiales bacterium]|nr:hypothetical protein [Acidimicrobiales bacterium]